MSDILDQIHALLRKSIEDQTNQSLVFVPVINLFHLDFLFKFDTGSSNICLCFLLPNLRLFRDRFSPDKEGDHATS